MSLTLVLAAVLNAQPAPAPCIPDLQAKPAADQPGPCRPRPPVLMAVRDDAAPPTLERTPNLFRQPDNCGAIVDGIVRRQEVALRGRRPAAQYAVARRIDGCMVPAPVGYRQDYLLPPEPQPARPEGGPPRRR
jgi:hypothetical protein